MDSQEATAINVYAESHLERDAAEGPMHPAAGEYIQGFQVIGLAPDQGAESDLYIALAPDNRKAVFKLYRPGVQRSTAVDEVANNLHHPRIASALLIGTWNGRPYEIAPFFEKGSLAHLIERDGPLKLSTARRLLQQLIEGLTALHRAGIQHRDLKPSNILIKSDNPLEVVLSDFGSSALATMTLLTQVRTTLAYAAPETLTGMYSRASDYWSLGIILIEALTGQNPLQWFGSSKIVGYQIVQGKIPIPDSLPAEWQLLLKGLLERDHYKRWDEARILRWLAESEAGAIQKKGDSWRRLILAGSAAAIIAVGSLAGVEVWQSVQGTYQRQPPAAPTEYAQPGNGSTESRSVTQRLDLKANPWLRIGLCALAWILAISLALVGFAHCVGGIPHGFSLICGGVALAAVAIYLPHLLR
jgi:serine/threonine protein kinase